MADKTAPSAPEPRRFNWLRGVLIEHRGQPQRPLFIVDRDDLVKVRDAIGLYVNAGSFEQADQQNMDWRLEEAYEGLTTLLGEPCVIQGVPVN